MLYTKNTAHIWILIIFLLFSLTVRLILIFNGGEPLHDDGPEFFGLSKRLYKYLLLGNWNEFFSTPVFGHWGGALLGIIPFFITPSWLSPAQMFTLFFAAPSVINIYLLYRVTIHFGGSQKTALISAGLYTLAFSGFYQAQHGLYYDFSLMFFLLAAIFVLKKSNGLHNIIFAGIFCFLCFFSYYGYWTISLTGMLFATFHNSKTLKAFFVNGLLATSGFLAPLILFFSLGYLNDVNYFEHFFKFSRTITNGNFDQGYQIPFLFLWHAEGLLSLLWLACLLWSFVYTKKYAVKCSLIATVFIYVLWVTGSNFTENFVVYGRLVKGLVPILCLNSAFIISAINVPGIIALFVLLIPGPLVNTWKNWPPTHFQDIIKHERGLRKVQGDNRIIKLTTRCIPDHPTCHLMFPSARGEDCITEKSYVSKYNLPFNQYEGITREARDILKDHLLLVEINNCKKTNLL